MRIAHRIVVLLLVVSVAEIVRGQSPASPAGYPAVGEPTRIALTSNGAEPRKALRYAIPKDYKGRLVMDMSMSLLMSVMGQSMPPMDLPSSRIGVDMTVTDVSSAGDVTYSIAFSDAEGAPVNADLKSITGTTTITSRGVPREAKMDTSKVTDPQLSQMVGSMTSSLNSISMPFPEEAVGIGARWEVRQAMASGGMNIFQKVACELTAFDGKSATIGVKIEQTAPAQPMNSPMMPPGTDARLDSMTGAGTGTMNVPLDGLVSTSEMTVKTVASMTVNAGGNQQPMGLETTIKLKVAPVKK